MALVALAAVTVTGPFGGGPAFGQADCPGADSELGGASAAELSRAALCLVNLERSRQGLGLLGESAELQVAAERHAADLVARPFFAVPSPEGTLPRNRAEAAGYKGEFTGEALTFMTGAGATPRAAVAQWLADPVTRDVILLSNSNQAGVGLAAGVPSVDHATGLTYVIDLGATPVVGQTVVIRPLSGTVRASSRGRKFRKLTRTSIVRVGTTLDTRRGTAKLRSAADGRGRTQFGTFSDGTFKVAQARGRRPVTDLLLRGELTGCESDGSSARAGVASPTARAAARSRRLRASGGGRFRTRGRNASAIVRGTTWLTEDRCDGTLIAVRRGSVVVRDRVSGRTIRLRAGQRYLARDR